MPQFPINYSNLPRPLRISVSLSQVSTNVVTETNFFYLTVISEFLKFFHNFHIHSLINLLEESSLQNDIIKKFMSLENVFNNVVRWKFHSSVEWDKKFVNNIKENYSFSSDFLVAVQKEKQQSTLENHSSLFDGFVSTLTATRPSLILLC